MRLIPFLVENARWLLAGFALTFASSFGQTFFISVFAGNIRAEFGLSHGEWGGLYALATTASAAVMVFAGSVTDRFRVRWIAPVLFTFLGVAALSMSQVSAVWALGLILFTLRLLGQGMMGHTAMVAMGRWFLATRGRAVSVAGLGVALGEVALPVIFVALLGFYDWRFLWAGAGLTLILFAPVLMGLLTQERTPQSFGGGAGSLGLHGRMWTRHDVLRHPVLWALVPTIVGPAAWNTAFFFHQVHMAEVKGWSHLTLVTLFPAFTVTAVGSMVLAGYLVDRIGSARLAKLYLLPFAMGYLVVAATQTPAAMAIGMILMGLSAGFHATLMTTLWAELYGTANLGAIRAMLGAVMVLGTAIGPGLTGALIDLGLTFPQQGYGIAAYFAAAALLAHLGLGNTGARTTAR
jgi:MFS family permease